MKENEVIKDYKVQKYILYAEKEDGTYGTVEGGSYLIENDLEDFWQKKKHLEQTLREKLLKNEISVIRYLMTLEEMTGNELALRAGLSYRKVKKHLTSEGFQKIKVYELKKYSKVFNLPIAGFFQIILTNSGQNFNYHFYYENKLNTEKFIIKQTETANPCMVLTKTEEVKYEQ